jgi:hypothetical protein
VRFNKRDRRPVAIPEEAACDVADELPDQSAEGFVGDKADRPAL